MNDPAAPYAEVIGDPIAHSRSPALHDFWLRTLGMQGDYRPVQVMSGGLRVYLEERRRDPLWRGANVTAPHKQALIPLLDQLDLEAARIGAVNCVVPMEGRLIGYNSDVDGVVEALGSRPLHGAKAVVIGAGGAARAALAALSQAEVGRIDLLVRTPAKAAGLRHLSNLPLQISHLHDASAAFADAALIINATRLGMADAPPMSESVLNALPLAAPGAALLDMVYQPLETPLLAAARRVGLMPIDGLAMLIGQARRSFELFFGLAPPAPVRELREALERN